MAVSSTNNAGGQQTWRVPEISRCRAMPFMNSDDVVYCLMERPHECGFSLRFGLSHLCLHPKRGEIVARTKKASAGK